MSNKRFYNFVAVSFISLSHAGGAEALQWNATPTGSTASLRSIVAVNDREVWASGTGGTVLRTVDEGKHWTRMSGLPDDLDFRGLQTFDGHTLHLISAGSGSKSTIYRSIDAGEHWKLVHQNKVPEAFFDGIGFYDGLRGLVVGDPVDGRFFLLATSDGGATWARLEGPTARDGEGAFAASNTSLIVHRPGLAWFGTGGVLGGRVFSSFDWGRTWTPVPTTLRHDSATAGVFGMAFPDDKHGYATGGDYKSAADAQGVLSETEDGGVSWNPLTGPSGYRSAIVTDGHHVLVTGPAGSDYKAGPKADWATIPGEGYHALSMPAKGKLVWACGSNGRVASLRLK